MSSPSGFGAAVEGLLRQAQEQQRRLAEVQRQRAELRVTGECPDGLVRVTVDGDMKVGDIELNARAMRLDSFSLAEAMQAAIDVAYAAFEERQREMLSEMLGDSEMVRRAQDGTLTPEDWFRQFGVDLSDPARNLRR
ncbi:MULTISPECIES: YbaB/EbfC family nucleoid-associated protein [unclassified Micromonospora]|uniref:YbaB/EbfC family nucleoid-associated protein n=1 Tax=unclassified Micromonospora TaxID=2617518 RepID=UPI001C211A99|nr:MULTISPECIES: YbaB/EbfC family nucleoid-associated protein [unclassified Micromonospora]MBU8858535.1 YbaB/EbfC family nucleoid-associated protein [Micromonospora sp. WMMB482]MDM4784178.1 YbaB/EbfC family nucleoid-associated protein [Micromonospora sp. b486]